MSATYAQKNKQYQEELQLLDEKLQNSAARRKETLDRASSAEREDTEAALRQKYVENRLALKRMPQIAAAQGLSGGAVRSAFRKTDAAYATGRDNLVKERDRAVAKLLETYTQGKEKDYESYKSRLAALRRKYEV